MFSIPVRYAFTGDVLRHLSTLFASIAHFQKSDFEVEIIYSFTVEETAHLIRQIGEVSRAQSAVWKKQEWIKRKWLTNEASAVRHDSCDIIPSSTNPFLTCLIALKCNLHR